MRLLATTTLCLCLATTASAQNFTWNGVFTQGLFHTDDNSIYGPSEDDISLDFTELSLNGSYNLPKNFRIAGQTIYRHAGAGFDGVDLDYLFIDAQPLNTESMTGGVRLGRVKSFYGLYNEARDIAFTRPSIYLSQSIYRDVTLRQTMISAEGIHLYAFNYTDHGQWNIELGYGFSTRDDDLENVNAFGGTADVELDTGFSYRLQYVSNTGNFMVSYGALHSNDMMATTSVNVNALVPTLPFTVPPLDVVTDFSTALNILTLSYSFNTWTAIIEYTYNEYDLEAPRISADATTLALLPPTISALIPAVEDFESEAYYFQLQKQLSRKVEAFFRYDVMIANTDDSKGTAFEASGIGVDHSRFAYDTGIGIRWRPKMDMLVNMEYHYVDGTGWLNDSDNSSATGPSQYWNILAASFSYRF